MNYSQYLWSLYEPGICALWFKGRRLIMVGFPHRIITARKEKAWRRHFFHQIEPNWPLPHSTVPVPQMRDARPASWVTYCSICTSTMPWAQNRTGKDSILMWRRFTFPIFLIFIYGFLDDPCVLFKSFDIMHDFVSSRTFYSIRLNTLHHRLNTLLFNYKIELRIWIFVLGYCFLGIA